MSEQPDKEKDPDFEKNFKWKSDEVEDLIMKRIYEVYDIEAEPEASEEDEDDNQEQDEISTMSSDEQPGTWEDSKGSFWASISTASKLLVWLTFLWPLSYFIAKYLFPDSLDSVDKELVPSLLVIPSGILMGINGLLMLFNPNTNEQVSQNQSGLFRPIAGIFSILAGWGVAAFFIWNYFLQEL